MNSSITSIVSKDNRIQSYCLHTYIQIALGIHKGVGVYHIITAVRVHGG